MNAYQPMRAHSTFRKQTGLTLIEVMIAMLLGVFLIGGVIQIFISTKQTYRMQENLSRLQENGRFAVDFLTRDIRMAGYRGCSGRPVMHNILNNPTGFLNDFDTAISGFEATSETAWTPIIDADITSPLGGSDVITIRRASNQAFTVTTHAQTTSGITLQPATATVANLTSAGFLQTDGTTNNCRIAVVSNCTDATVFQVSTIAGNVLSQAPAGNCTANPGPGNATINLRRRYDMGGQVYTIDTISYYIRLNPNNQPSLYRRVGSGNAEELVEGVEQMQIVYGIDAEASSRPNGNGDGIPNYYTSAAAINPGGGALTPNMDQVVSVRVSLLLRTIEDNLTEAPVPYSYNGNTGIDPQDRRIRRVFSSTISVRNR